MNNHETTALAVEKTPEGHEVSAALRAWAKEYGPKCSDWDLSVLSLFAIIQCVKALEDRIATGDN
jgi:hypothetical protein